MCPLTLCVGAVQFGLEQHPEARHFLSLQLIQTSPHMVTDQVQLFTETTILMENTRHQSEKDGLNVRSPCTCKKIKWEWRRNGCWPWCPLCWLFAVSLWSEGLSPKPQSPLWGTCHSTGRCPATKSMFSYSQQTESELKYMPETTEAITTLSSGTSSLASCLSALRSIGTDQTPAEMDRSSSQPGFKFILLQVNNNVFYNIAYKTLTEKL